MGWRTTAYGPRRTISGASLMVMVALQLRPRINRAQTAMPIPANTIANPAHSNTAESGKKCWSKGPSEACQPNNRINQEAANPPCRNREKALWERAVLLENAALHSQTTANASHRP